MRHKGKDSLELGLMLIVGFVLAARGQTIGQNGMVATHHPLATQAGLRILQQGGNAADAAIASAAVLAVVSPFMCGLGGVGGYALHGPIDNFGASTGGNLRRAYVSHGCIRLRAQDIAEIYVMLHGHSYVPVTVQRVVTSFGIGSVLRTSLRRCYLDKSWRLRSGHRRRDFLPVPDQR